MAPLNRQALRAFAVLFSGFNINCTFLDIWRVRWVMFVIEIGPAKSQASEHNPVNKQSKGGFDLSRSGSVSGMEKLQMLTRTNRKL